LYFWNERHVAQNASYHAISLRSTVEPDHGQLTPPYFRYTLRFLSRFPNFDLPWAGGLRRRAVDLLQLSEGDQVLDVGCGLGGSFPFLLSAVGQSGRLVGVEISPRAAKLAQRRVEANHWTNIQVVVCDARTVVLSGKFDGLLLLGAPDIYGSPETLENLRPYLKPRARVVAFGAKLTNRRLGAGYNVILRSMMRLSFASTPKLALDPWAPLTTYFDEIQVQEYFYGGLFLASGSLRSQDG
jgi:SAM-dependent methyltransferase